MSPAAALPSDSWQLRLRRAQLVLGLGVLALLLGSLVSAALSMRLSVRAADLPGPLRWALAVAVSRVWLLAALPLLCQGAARVLVLRPRATALGAALSGEAVLVLLELARAGLSGLWAGLPSALARGGTFVLGVWLCERALRVGSAAREAKERAAATKAGETRVEYADFLARAGGGEGTQGDSAAPASPTPTLSQGERGP